MLSQSTRSKSMLNQNLLPESVTEINHVLGYLHDSYKGYRESADVIEESFLSDTFTLAAARRSEMINQLEKFLLKNNATPMQKGTVRGTAHRIFVDLKALVTGKDTTAILKEVERGETILMNAYQSALTNINHPEVSLLLQKQLNSIQEDMAKWELAELN